MPLCCASLPPHSLPGRERKNKSTASSSIGLGGWAAASPSRSICRLASIPMEVESAKCECCGLREDCTREYIAAVKAGFGGRWLCGLCTEAVRDEVAAKKRGDLEGALRDHMSFCAKFGKKGPAFRVADGMRQMLRRRSSDISASAAAAAASSSAAAS